MPAKVQQKGMLTSSRHEGPIPIVFASSWLLQTFFTPNTPKGVKRVPADGRHN